ncbi:BA75_03866T0 [Komagataella pastoris]|uniref:BA75_03866T0 n=1 Tax=Komagataella pastoris TaxID=4922 RepID=A0A1B2JFT8_PICPA|nr:BA75_03866T0 [Komagataella pastoris]
MGQQGNTQKLERLQEVIFKNIFIGALYGSLIAIPTDMLLRWKSPMYRWLGTRGRVFYYTIWMASCANFLTERQVMKFEEVTRFEDEQKKQRLLELSVANGSYYGDDTDMIKIPKRK